MENKENISEVAVYIHWPFCISKCNYCSFNSYVSKAPENYINHYINKIETWSEYLAKKKVTSIYFGGGTPSLMKLNDLDLIIQKIYSSISCCAEPLEITLEVNPETVDYNKLSEFKKIGVNRISLGIQSFVKKHLEIMGRKNTREKNLEILDYVRKLYANYTMDFIYGLPYQNNWEEELREILELSKGCPHYSIYELSVDKGTVFYEKYKDLERVENYYRITNEILLDNGYEHYEISNYALSGYYSRHNSSYWKYKEYLGIGAGAHSRVNIEGKFYAIEETSNLHEWANKKPMCCVLSNAQVIEERTIVGLRSDIWCPISSEVHHITKIKNFADTGYLQLDSELNSIKSTYIGREVLDYILKEILL